MATRVIANVCQDVRYLLRTWRKSPLFVATAVLTIGVGIGVNTAVFSVVNAIVFRPLPVPEPAQLVVVAAGRGSSLGPVSFADLEDYRDRAGNVLADVAGYTAGFVGLAPDGGRPARVLTTWVTGNYFALLGVKPALGRLIRAEEGRPGRIDPVVVLGYDTWRRRYGGSADAIGRRVLINGTPCTVVGVAPAGFHGTFAFSDSEVYLPLNWNSPAIADDRGHRPLHAIARLRSGVDIRRAQAALTVVAARLAREYPDTDGGITLRVFAEPLARPEEGNARSNAFAATAMLTLVGLVLLIAEVNVANLLLVRAASRRRAMAIRGALGASRSRLVQQQMTETGLLAGLGGVAGLVLGTGTARLLADVKPPGDLPVLLDFHPDARVVAYAWALTVVTALAIGWLTARPSTRVDVNETLREGDGASHIAPGRYRLRKVLVVIQIAVCLALLVAAGLFQRSLISAGRASFGFRPEGVLNVQMDAGEAGYAEARARRFFQDVRRQVARLPGVQDVAFAATVPMGYVRLTSRIEAEGMAVPRGGPVVAAENAVDPAYFETMGIDIERGRPFAADDDTGAEAVAVVNQRLADTLWAGLDPIGRRFRQAGTDQPWLRVVGLTGTGKYRSIFEDPTPYFYVPLAQQFTAMRVLHVRTTLPPASMAPAVERTIRALAPDLPLYDIQTMVDALGSGYGLFAIRTVAVFAGVLAVIAGALACSGLYALVAFLTGERTREIGIRVALGAGRRDVVMMVLVESAKLALTGVVLGTIAAAGVGHLVAGLLFGVPPADPAAVALGAVGLLVVVLGATYLPVRRALTVDPVRALRSP
jgi:putative ABC transport system permease protein